jgi:hypothetical protein
MWHVLVVAAKSQLRPDYADSIIEMVKMDLSLMWPLHFHPGLAVCDR